MIKRILLGLSGTPYTAVATQRAVEAARRFNAEVTGVTIVDTERLARVGPVPLGAGTVARDMAKKRLEETCAKVAEAVEAFEATCREHGLSCRTVHEEGDPLDAFKAHARYHDINIVGLRGLLDYGVVDNSDSIDDLFLRGVRPIVAVSSRFRTIGRVLIAYNGSMASAKAMRNFCQMRLWPEATVRVAHFGSDDPSAGALLNDAADYVRHHRYEVDTHESSEDARTGILRQAHDWNADLIVLGSLGKRRLLGHSVLDIVKRADLPLFLSH